MRLKSQFAILTAAVALVPVVFGVIIFGSQRMPRDPREPTRSFLELIYRGREAGAYGADGRPAMADLLEAARLAEMPVRELALVTAEGLVLESSFPHLPAGARMGLKDLVRQPKGGAMPARPEVQLMAIDFGDPESDLVLVDVKPFWTRQDLRNRNIVTVGSFALGLFAVAGIISLVILRSIARAITTIGTDTAIVATGDLDHEVKGRGSSDFHALADAINLMRLNLKDMLARRSRMLMGIGHDLKTPIALIQGYADALKDEVAVDAETRAKYLGIIREKSGQLEDLASELMDFLKIGGDGAYAVKPVDPSLLLSDLGARFESDALLMKRTFRWGFGESMERSPGFGTPAIPMNRALAERALENLVMNAFKFSGSGGEVSLALLDSPEGLAYSVRDDGPGIAEADRPYVFDAFYRASPSRADGGHGLGLTVVKAVAELHGWKAAVGPRTDGRPGSEARMVLAVSPVSGSEPGDA